MDREARNTGIDPSIAPLSPVRVAAMSSQGSNPIHDGIEPPEDRSDVGDDLIIDAALVGCET